MYTAFLFLTLGKFVLIVFRFETSHVNAGWRASILASGLYLRLNRSLFVFCLSFFNLLSVENPRMAYTTFASKNITKNNGSRHSFCSRAADSYLEIGRNHKSLLRLCYLLILSAERQIC